MDTPPSPPPSARYSWVVRHRPTADVLYEATTSHACRVWLKQMVDIKQLQRPGEEYEVAFLGDRDG